MEKSVVMDDRVPEAALMKAIFRAAPTFYTLQYPPPRVCEAEADRGRERL